MSNNWQGFASIAAALGVVASLGWTATARPEGQDDNHWWIARNAPLAQLPREGWSLLSEAKRANVAAGLGGIQKATALTPASGLLIVLFPGGVKTCSGVLVGERAFLTAAHCVCDDGAALGAKSNYRTCASRLASVRTQVLFPAGGLFGGVGKPLVNEAYRAVDGDMDARARPAADLAIVMLDGAPPVTPVTLGAPIEGERYLMSGFGALVEVSTRGDAADRSSLEPDTEYRPGLGQVSLLSKTQTQLTACGEQPAQDVFCTLHTPVGEQDALSRTVTACKGDSGSPLYAVRDGQAGAVVGLASSLSHGDACLAAAARFTYFTDLSRPEHRAWIARHAGPAPRPRPRPRWSCGDLMAGEANPHIETYGPGLLTVMPATPEGRRVARTGVDGLEPGQCHFLAGLGAWTCEVRAGQRPRVLRDGGVAQITMCWNPETQETTP